MLYKVKQWKIGVSQVKNIYINTKSEETQYLGRKVDVEIFGFPVKVSD